MRIVSLLAAILALAGVSAQQGKTDNPPREQRKTPTTLAEAHAELERILSPQTLAEIDAMPSEKDMIKYHFSLGLNIRNGWGLWAGSPLAKHMEELGFTHPDGMSSVILVTFWRKRHGQDLRLEELTAAAKISMAAALNAQDEEKNRAQEAKAAIQNIMMGLRFERRAVPTVRMPDHADWRLRARFLSHFRGGVFLTAYCRGRVQDGARKTRLGEDFFTRGFYFDPADRKIHEIRVAEVNEVYAAVAAGERAWLAGLTNGKVVLVGVGARDRITVPLPQEDEVPDLGFDGQSLLAVYSKRIFQLTDRTWTLVHSGDIVLPRSGPPPQRHGNMIFLRDEGIHETRKRLWWLTLGEPPHVSALDRDVGLVGPDGPAWYESSSYCVTAGGDLWACVGTRHVGYSVLRRSKDGHYSIAIINSSVRFTGELLRRSAETDEDVFACGVAPLPDDTLLLLGNVGLYRLKDNELVQELAFTNTREEISREKGIYVSRWYWDPSNALVLDDKSYFISGAFGGVYLLGKGTDGQWSFLCLDEKLGDPVVW